MSQLQNKEENEGLKDLKDVYDLIVEDLAIEYKSYRKGSGCRTRTDTKVTYKRFRRIVRKYIDICIKEAIDSVLGVRWLPRFGTIQVVSRLYKKRIYNYRRNARGWYKNYINVEKYGGYFSSLKWHAPKSYRRGRIAIDRYYKKKITYNMHCGKEYLKAS